MVSCYELHIWPQIAYLQALFLNSSAPASSLVCFPAFSISLKYLLNIIFLYLQLLQAASKNFLTCWSCFASKLLSCSLFLELKLSGLIYLL